MTTTVKRSITLDADVDAELSSRFAPGARSRFLNDSARVALAQLRLRELLDEMEAADGPVPQEIIDEVAHLPRPR